MFILFFFLFSGAVLLQSWFCIMMVPTLVLTGVDQSAGSDVGSVWEMCDVCRSDACLLQLSHWD